MEYCVLVLADGRTFQGRSFGARAQTVDEILHAVRDAECGEREPVLASIGEVVFNTAMSGYVEVLTDPSYTGQIVAMTYPHMGNYGVSYEWAESAGSMTPAAFVTRTLYDGPVPTGRLSLDDALREAGIPGITDVDTRTLTRLIRNEGSQNGVICRPEGDSASLSEDETIRMGEMLRSFPAMEGRGLIDFVGSTERQELPPVSVPPGNVSGGDVGSSPHLVLYDCGTKTNIIRELHALGCRLTLLPSRATAAEIREVGADGVLISNGPGDPAVLKHQVEQTRQLIGEMPVLGICLGHQIIAEAVGARTEKMKFGHHGVNHPVRDSETGRVFVTSQNHGFTVDEKTLPEGVSVWFRNANDGTVEGLWDRERSIRTTQFHPESAPGPTDSRWIFSAFLQTVSDSPGRSRSILKKKDR